MHFFLGSDEKSTTFNVVRTRQELKQRELVVFKQIDPDHIRKAYMRELDSRISKCVELNEGHIYKVLFIILSQDLIEYVGNELSVVGFP